jgi:molybdopterin-binding protein
MKLSARNILKGTVVKITPGSINSEVVLKLAEGIEVVSIISKESVASLGLKPGVQAFAIVKSSNVMIGVDA